MRISTSCSGIDTPVFAAKILGKELDFAVENVFAVERNPKCCGELLHSGNATPAHIFSDLTVFLTAHVRRDAAKLPSWDYPRLRKLVLGPVLVKRAWFNRRGGCIAWASLAADLCAMIHIAGVPCVDHSSMGKRKGKEGKTNFVFYSWCVIRRALRAAQHRRLASPGVVQVQGWLAELSRLRAEARREGG